ncbi:MULTISPECIES: DUF397 domain-containing protein [unclassified Streptomyces]|uniref:DUF397 domain-containing protein n=1 Tax=unclassified Streptomyces TaxID=2593676 RepID=UPI0038690170|nr:DUF397 domain-containing protein [Streptomyces sp. NBC_00827]
MPDYQWQKSTFSPDASNCVYVAAPAPGTLYLRESDEPAVVLTTTPARLQDLIRTLKAGAAGHSHD